MNSYNHYAYGAVCQWLFEAVAGFRPDPENPGFKHIIFEPVIMPALSPVAASHDAATGGSRPAGPSMATRSPTTSSCPPAPTAR